MQRGNPAGKAVRYHGPHLIKIKVKIQKAVRALPPSRPWRGGSGEALKQVLFAKGGTALSQRGVCQCATIASMP
jgi:hypothetical protein